MDYSIKFIGKIGGHIPGWDTPFTSFDKTP
jgi:hypothetical protein